jgi:hypothetical protein
MAHLKNEYVSVMYPEMLPMFVSNRKGTLKPFGGPLKNLYNLHAYDDPNHRSRMATCYTRKDFRINGHRNYRPWRQQQIKSIKQMPQIKPAIIEEVTDIFYCDCSGCIPCI